MIVLCCQFSPVIVLSLPNVPCYFPSSVISVFTFSRTLAILPWSQYFFCSRFLLCFENSLIDFVLVFILELQYGSVRNVLIASIHHRVVWFREYLWCMSFFPEKTKEYIYISISVGPEQLFWSQSLNHALVYVREGLWSMWIGLLSREKTWEDELQKHNPHIYLSNNT